VTFCCVWAGGKDSSLRLSFYFGPLNTSLRLGELIGRVDLTEGMSALAFACGTASVKIGGHLYSGLSRCDELKERNIRRMRLL
jgi:hypothetical protein